MRSMRGAVALLIAAGLCLGTGTAAHAVDVKISGVWHQTVSFADREFTKNATGDTMQAATRLRTQVELIASESLKGVVYFEVGPNVWGNGNSGASLGTDGKMVKVRYSYTDWVVPSTEIKVRLGLQNFTLPNAVMGHPVLGGGGADAAGAAISSNFNENVGATLFWMRAENDNPTGDYGTQYGFSDAMDFVGLSVPVKTEGLKLSPWAMYGFIGRDSFDKAGASEDQAKLVKGLLPLGATPATLTGNGGIDRHGNAWWGGISGQFTLFQPITFGFDAVYGSADLGSYQQDGQTWDLKRSGWYAGLLAEYQLDWMTPGLVLWYASGDDGNPRNGSERLPSVCPDITLTSYGFDETNFSRAGQRLGMSISGTWGAMLRFKDIGTMEKLKHTARFVYYKGTNNPENVRSGLISDPSSTLQSMYYLTTKDSAFEANFDSQYSLYKNLDLIVELGYIRLDLDDALWASFDQQKNNFKGSVCVRYSF